MDPTHRSAASQAVFQTASILAQDRLAEGVFRICLAADRAALPALPGQFFMVRLSGLNDPLIGRALALYDVATRDGHPVLELVYFVQGKLTTRLAECGPGAKVDLWGPLGNGFVPRATRNLILVAGGIGYTPFLAVAKERLGVQRYGQPSREAPIAGRVVLCYGARTAGQLASVEDFQRLGVDVRLSTDDGSRGHRGPVTDLMREALDEIAARDLNFDAHVLCCGPEPMMEAVSQLAAERQTPCDVSLETPMACGIGICFTCVAAVRDAAREEGWDYQRTCISGPVFDASRIVW